MATRGTLKERFRRYVNKDGPRWRGSKCWMWTGAYDGKRQYGRIRRGGRDDGLVPAHVVAYELEYGPVPDGLELDHLCRRGGCVRPSHLEAVTHAENQRRMALALFPVHSRCGQPYTATDNLGRRICHPCRAGAERRRRHRRAQRTTVLSPVRSRVR